MDMIKRVAQAIKSGMEDSGVVSLVANGPNGKAALAQFFEVLAMDAIEAIREPTPEIEAAMRRAFERQENIWSAGIDAALDEGVRGPAGSADEFGVERAEE